MRRNGGIIGDIVRPNWTENVTGLYDIQDVHHYRSLDDWPYTKIISDVFVVGGTTLNETTDATRTLRFLAKGFRTGEVIYWSTLGTGTSPTSALDFDSSVNTGSIVYSGSLDGTLQYVDVTAAADGAVEGNETFQFKIWWLDHNQNVVGVVTTGSYTIQDTSTVALGEDLTAAFFPISEFTVNDGSGATQSAYSVGEVRQSFAGTGRLYLLHKASAGTVPQSNFYLDAPVAAVQVLNSSGTTVKHTWWFGNRLDNQGWETSRVEYIWGSTGTGLTSSTTPTFVAQTPTYYSLGASATADRFNLATATGSGGTGALDGIPSPTGPMTVGEATMAQSSSETYYMYREMSGGSINFVVPSRSPSITWASGDLIRVAYIIGNRSATAYDADDTFFVGIN